VPNYPVPWPTTCNYSDSKFCRSYFYTHHIHTKTGSSLHISVSTDQDYHLFCKPIPHFQSIYSKINANPTGYSYWSVYHQNLYKSNRILLARSIFSDCCANSNTSSVADTSDHQPPSYHSPPPPYNHSARYDSTPNIWTFRSWRIVVLLSWYNISLLDF